MRPRFTTAPMEHSTGFGPLIALGFWVRQQDLWAPVRSRVRFTEPTHCDDPIPVYGDGFDKALHGMYAGRVEAY